MAKSAVNLDTVLINVESNAGKVSSNISKLANHLETLRSSMKGGFNNLNKLADALERLSKSTKKLNDTATNLKSLNSITKSLSQLKDIKSPTGLKNTIDSLSRLPEITNRMDTKTFQNLARVSNELAHALTPVADKLQQVSDGYSAFSKIQNTFGKSASTNTKYTKQQKSILSSLVPIVKKIGSSFLQLSKNISLAFGKGAYSNLKKFHSKFKQVFLSLLGTRTLFTLIRKAAAEYQAFDTQLQDFSQNVWRAFGAQLAPVLYYVMDLFKQFVRVIYSLVYALTGIDLIARANEKAMAGWGKSAKDTLGSLQKFDDLNVVEFNNKGAGDDNKLIDLDKIDLSPIQKIIDWVKTLKKEIQDAFNTGEWAGVGDVFAEGINEGLTYILGALPTIKANLYEIVSDFADFLNAAIKGINWKDFGTALTQTLTILPNLLTRLISETDWTVIGTGLKNFFEGFDLGLYIRVRADTWVTFVKSLGTALSQVDWSQVGKNLGDAIKQALLGINRIISEINFKEIGSKIRDVLVNMDWAEIGQQIVNLFKGLFTGLGELLQGLFDTDIDADKLAKGAGAIILVVGAFALLKKILSAFTSTKKSVGEAVESFGNMFESIGKATQTIALLGGIALVLNELSDVLKSFSETGLSATDGLILLGGTLGALAASFVAMSLATKAMDWTGVAGAVVLLGGLALIINQLTDLFNIFSESGMSLGESLGFMSGVLGIALVSLTALAVIGKALASDPLILLGVAAALLAIGAFLEIIKATLPTILDACGKFIDTIAPHIIKLIDTIGSIINDIIHSLGDVLPPIISSVGNLFTTIFNGVATVINSVGKVIVNIMNTAGNLVDKVLNSILNFINKLGPAINVFVDNAIAAVTKLINFIVSSVEYLINTAIIKPINKLINTINNNAIAEKLGWKIGTLATVSIDRFAPKLETGTNEIPYEGIYHLHPGEAVVPKKYNPAIGNGGSDEMNAKLDTLIDIMNNMNFTNVVNIGNKKVYEGQQAYNRTQQNKYGTINIY